MTRLAFALLLTAAAATLALAAPIPKKKAKLDPPTDEQLDASANNLKQILLALHNYESAMGHLPNDIVDKKGKLLLSWRVAILPYMEDDTQYREFKLDEPWDSETNKPLVAKLPKVYAPIRVEANEGETFYRAFVGKDTAFEAGKKLTFVGIPDGTSNTVAVVEAGEPGIWSKPGDLPFDAKKPLPKLGGLFDGDFHVALCDGSVKLVSGKLFDPKQFARTVTRSDGENVSFDTAFPPVEKK